MNTVGFNEQKCCELICGKCGAIIGILFLSRDEVQKIILNVSCPNGCNFEGSKNE
jgi:hypothetical protein